MHGLLLVGISGIAAQVLQTSAAGPALHGSITLLQLLRAGGVACRARFAASSKRVVLVEMVLSAPRLFGHDVGGLKPRYAGTLASVRWSPL